ncbi:MAG: M20/M25/M40 family metallo-hydrolase [Flavonifractor plautii]
MTLGQGERTLLLRADMDALQVEEHNDLPFCAANGCMHACGHDMHTAILLGAAEVLKRHEQELPCRVKLVFQPGEELGTGAQSLVEAGLLKILTDAAAAPTWTPYKVGECSYCTGGHIRYLLHLYPAWGGGQLPAGRDNQCPGSGQRVFQALSGLVQREVSGFDTAIQLSHQARRQSAESQYHPGNLRDGRYPSLL